MYVCPMPDCNYTTRQLAHLCQHFRHHHWPLDFCPVCGATRTKHKGTKFLGPYNIILHASRLRDKYHAAFVYLVTDKYGARHRVVRRYKLAAHTVFRWPGVKFIAEPVDGPHKPMIRVAILAVLPVTLTTAAWVDVFRALANAKRIAILRELARGALHRVDLAQKVFGKPVYRVIGPLYYHLHILEDAGLIRNVNGVIALTDMGHYVLKIFAELNGGEG